LVKLCVEDISELPDGAGSILVRRSKTDQASTGRLAYLSKESIVHVQRWLAASGVVSGPLFRAVRGAAVGAEALHPGTVNRVLKQLAQRAGLTPDTQRRLSGHSMRVGVAVDMAENGIDLVLIMQAGGWKTLDMVPRYTEQIDLLKSGMARLYALQGTGHSSSISEAS
jgi:integrase/recombinase XerD